MMDPQAHLQSLKARAAGIRPRADDIARARALRFTQPGFDRAAWRQMCARGWLGLCLKQDAGGGREQDSGGGREQDSGGGRPQFRRFSKVAHDLGAVLAPEPLIPTAMAAMLLPPHHRAAVLAGERIVLLAWREAPGSLDTAGMTAQRDGRLTGRKHNVPMAAGADAFLVTLADGVALVARDAPGLTLDAQPMPDGGHAATLTFDNTPAEVLDGDAAAALDLGIVATAAYLTGVIEGALATLPELSAGHQPDNARQFRGDLETQLSLTIAVVQAGAAALGGGQTQAVRQAAASRAMLRAADAAMTVTMGCVRLGRGVGETDAELYRRKAQALAGAYGSQAAHRARCRPAGG